MELITEYQIQIGETSQTQHCLFLRQHRVRESTTEKPEDKTVFIVGIPCFLDEDSLRALFNRFGNVSSVSIRKVSTPKSSASIQSSYFSQAEHNPKGYKIGYVTFEKSRELDNVLIKHQTGILKPSTLTTGLKRWAKEYNTRIPDSEGLQNDIDNFMNKFDQQERIEREKLQESSKADEDGWIKVTKKSRTPGFARNESVMKQISKTMAQKEKKKQLNNFYRFQIKESKMKNLVALRQKFEEDKKRITALKATRRFKPF